MPTTSFKNEAIAVQRKYPHQYGFNRAPKHLFLWSRLFQSVISQAGTFLLTGQFHDGHCAIYKSEGGCVIRDVGELVLGPDSCYIDGYASDKKREQETPLAKLITQVVLNWDPNDPIASMIDAAALHLDEHTPKQFEKVDWSKPRRVRNEKNELVRATIKYPRPDWDLETLREKLREALEKSKNGGIFGGNCLSSFFSWNPFSKVPKDRKYERFVQIVYGNMNDSSVDEKFADEDLAERLYDELRAAVRKAHGNCYGPIPVCCSPNRKESGELEFFVNTGGSTQLDGWKTQAQLEAYIANPERLTRQ